MASKDVKDAFSLSQQATAILVTDWVAVEVKLTTAPAERVEVIQDVGRILSRKDLVPPAILRGIGLLVFASNASARKVLPRVVPG